MLLARGPTSIVAMLHDTSEKMIRKHYAKYIVEFSDAIARAALVELALPASPVAALRDAA
jgi:hypothetical protein